jgi:hypothetical protein
VVKFLAGGFLLGIDGEEGGVDEVLVEADFHG